MARMLIVAVLLVGFSTQTAQAGLQSALQSTLIGQQAAETTPLVIPIGSERVATTIKPVALSGTLDPIISLSPSIYRRPVNVTYPNSVGNTFPVIGIETLQQLLANRQFRENSRFIDPINSTIDEGVFVSGPEFGYNPATGGVTIRLPALLGPEDELGLRDSFAPRRLRIRSRSLVDNPSIPEIAEFRRSSPLEIQLAGAGIFLGGSPREDGLVPSFIPTTSQVPIEIEIRDQELLVSPVTTLDFGAAEIAFDSLLNPGLRTDVFTASPNVSDATSLLPFLRGPFSATTGFRIDVNYSRTPYQPAQNVIRGNASSFWVEASPSREIFESFSQSIPEPSTLLLSLMAIAGLLVRRRNRL